MKRALLSALFGMTLGTALMGTPAAAECYADYKAKQDAPLRLHYGVAEIRGACAPGPAAQELAPRLARGGWTLLTVISVFGPEGLAQRRDDAGPNHLRY